MESPSTTKQVQRPTLYARRDITSRGKFGKTKLYDMMKCRQFPLPAISQGRFTRWRAADVDAWLEDPRGWMERNAPKSEGGAHHG